MDIKNDLTQIKPGSLIRLFVDPGNGHIRGVGE